MIARVVAHADNVADFRYSREFRRRDLVAMVSDATSVSARETW